MSNYKVEFTLKQHTPIIHFQSDQIGATLRATELKPKFDRFLKKHAFNDTFEEYKTFLIGYDENKYQTEKDFEGKEAFNYKIKIQLSKEQNITESIQRQKKDHQGNLKTTFQGDPAYESFNTFFGTMGVDWEKHPKYFQLQPDNILVQFISFNDEIISYIKTNFNKFLVHTNFGTRQTKGFGSFGIMKNTTGYSNFLDELNYYHSFKINLNDHETKIYLNVENNKGNYEFYVKFKQLFSAIESFYKTLRSGINVIDSNNNTKYYFKSFLFLYAKNKSWTWDKKIIKSKFLSNDDVFSQSKFEQMQSNGSEYLIRDLLGLSTIQEYRKNKKYSDYGFTVRHPKTEKDKLDKFNNQKINPNDIRRYKSPIVFKVIEVEKNIFQVYLITSDIPKYFLESEFTILQEKNKDIVNKIDRLSPPPFFDINDFLYEALFNYGSDIDTHVGDYKNKQEHKIVKYIYSHLQKASK